MRILIKNGQVIFNDEIRRCDILLEDGIISEISDICINPEREVQVIDANGCFVSSGFIDMHCHGGGGADFCDGTSDDVLIAARTHLRHGTTTLFPTVSSASADETTQALSAIAAASEVLPSICDAHLEGPYLSPAMCGAQKGGVLRLPDKDEYLRILADYSVARWSYSPELDNNYQFLSALIKSGVVPAAAHTDASCTQMLAAADRGCELITHLYSCTSTIKREKGFRTAGVTEAAYLSDLISSELIADGKHLPAELMRLAYKCIGTERLALVTDAMRAAGHNEKQSFIGKKGSGVACIIEDGVAKLPDRTAFAGSIATAEVLLRTCIAAGIPLIGAVKMLTATPARIMRLKYKGAIKRGFAADIVIFDKDINIKQVILQGRRAEEYLHD